MDSFSSEATMEIGNKMFEFHREGKDLRITVSVKDVSSRRLATAFQVDKDTLYIKEEWAELALWPNEHGRFNLQNAFDGTSFEVMGESRDSNNQSSTALSALSFTAPPSTSSSCTNLATKHSFKHFPKKSSNFFGCKIIVAEMKKTPKGVTFEEKNQTYLNVPEDSANVSFITDKVKEKFGEELTLVTGNGLPIHDEEGTRGSKFWKCSSRRVYAVTIPLDKKKDKKAKRKIQKECSSSSDSDDFREPPRSKKRLLNCIFDELKVLQGDISACVSMFQDLMHVNSLMIVPPSLVKLVNDGFKCKICLKVPMNPPVIATRCCNALLGCSECINNWYGGEGGLDKTCPNCREPRGYAQTYQLKGIDEFLMGFKRILSNSGSEMPE